MPAQLDKVYLRMSLKKTFIRLVTYTVFEGRPLTTKGRWINPLVLAFMSLAQRIPRRKSIRSPIFIIGTGRSGTTVLGKVLSMHDDVGFLNEPKALWHSLYFNEDVIGNYTDSAGRYRLSQEDVTEDLKERAHRLYGVYLSVTRSKRIVDKYPEMIFRIPFIISIFPDAKFIFLVRNGWDTCRSISNWSRRLGKKGVEVHDWWGKNDRKWNCLVDQIVSHDENLKSNVREIGTFCKHEYRAAVEWIVTMKEGMKLAESLPERTHVVRYEELISNPSDALEKIMSFCKLKDDPRMVRYAQNILKPVPPRKPLELPEVIKSCFIDTMKELGYES